MPDWSDRAAVAEFAAAGAEILGDDPAAARATAERIWDRTPGTEPAVQMANQLGMVFSKLDCKPRWRERLPELAIPALVVHGRRDPFFPSATAKRSRARSPVRGCSCSNRPRPRSPTRPPGSRGGDARAVASRPGVSSNREDGDEQQRNRRVHGREPRRRDRLHGGLPEYGEQRWYTSALAAEEVSFSWRRMLPGTGGRGSYGHRHPGQEEVYFVISGVVTFKIDDDVFEAGRRRRCGSPATRSAPSTTTPTTRPSC
jgi:mannose-6-phosphate isomerase-like protein (cupin superfamily)